MESLDDRIAKLPGHGVATNRPPHLITWPDMGSYISALESSSANNSVISWELSHKQNGENAAMVLMNHYHGRVCTYHQVDNMGDLELGKLERFLISFTKTDQE